MEGHCSIVQSPQWAVVPMEEEEEDTFVRHIHKYNSLKRTQLRSANLLLLQADVTADT